MSETLMQTRKPKYCGKKHWAQTNYLIYKIGVQKVNKKNITKTLKELYKLQSQYTHSYAFLMCPGCLLLDIA